MAFTMLLTTEGQPRPGLVCDRCDTIITSGDARVLWGPQHVDINDREHPFTTVTQAVTVGLGDIPFSVFVVCGEVCQDTLTRLYGDHGLESQWLSVSDYVAWIERVILSGA